MIHTTPSQSIKSSDRVLLGIRFSLLADPVFLFFSLTYAIGCPCVYGQWAYLPSLALESGLSKTDAASLVVINSAASPIGEMRLEQDLPVCVIRFLPLPALRSRAL